MQLICFIVVAAAAVESVWSGVVSGTQTAGFPAYRPHFHPVPLLQSASHVDVVRPSTPPSKHSQRGSPSSSSSQLSREGVSSQDGTGNARDHRHFSTTLHCPATDSSLQREESSDSGGVFLTPTSSSNVGLNLVSESNSVSRDSCMSSTDLPVTSLVNVGRKFGKLSEDSELECRGKDLSMGVVSRNTSPGDLWTVADAAEVAVREQSANALHIRSNSCFEVLYRRSEEQFVAASKTKKKSKKSRRNSQPSQAICSSAKSVAVYGGNPKWIWKS